MTSGRQPAHNDWLGQPIRILLWLLVVPPWVCLMIVPGVPHYGVQWLPRYFNVFGYDGFVNRLYGTVGSQVPSAGGTRGAVLPAVVIALLFATALVEGVGRRRNITWLRWAIAAPVALLVLALFVMVTTILGSWEGWVYAPTSLIHLGRRIGQPHWPVLILLIACVAALSWLVTAITLYRSPVQHSTGLRVGLMGLAVILWHSPLWLPQAPAADSHTVRVLCEAIVFWCLSATLVSTGTRSRQQPLGITRMLVRLPYCGEPLMYFLLWLLGPGLAFLFMLVVNAQQRAQLLLLLMYIPALLYPLQLIHRDMRRFRSRMNIETPACIRCRYDLRGTVAAKRHACPECGHPITDAQHQWIADHMIV